MLQGLLGCGRTSLQPTRLFSECIGSPFTRSQTLVRRIAIAAAIDPTVAVIASRRVITIIIPFVRGNWIVSDSFVADDRQPTSSNGRPAIDHLKGPNCYNQRIG